MFGEARRYLSVVRNNFNDNVKDNFGNSIDNDMFLSIDNNFMSLQETYEEAKRKENEINSLMMELRSIT